MKTLLRRLEYLELLKEAGSVAPCLLEAIETLKKHIQSVEA